MGRVIRIAFRGRKRVGGAIGRDHGQKDRDEDSRDEQECRTKGREKPQGGMPAAVRSQYSSAAISLAQKIWVLLWRAAGFTFRARKA
jgi:hypothetical protein